MMSPNHQSQFLNFLKENQKSKMTEQSGTTYVQNQRPKVTKGKANAASNLELQSNKRLTTPEVERYLCSWVKERQKIGGNISREMMKKKGLQIQSYLRKGARSTTIVEGLIHINLPKVAPLISSKISVNHSQGILKE